MKKALKLIGFIALVAVIGFSIASCGDDEKSNKTTETETTDDGENTIKGNNITTGAEVIYDFSIENLAQAKEKTEFSFCSEHGLLIDFVDGSPRVTVKNNKVTIILGTPKSYYLENLIDSFWIENEVTVNPSNAGSFLIDGFNTTDDIYTTDRYVLKCGKDADNWAFLVYADRDATLNGTDAIESKGVGTKRFNISLKKGWNYVFESFSVNTETVRTETVKDVKYTASTTLPSGYKWIVFEDHHH